MFLECILLFFLLLLICLNLAQAVWKYVNFGLGLNATGADMFPDLNELMLSPSK